MKALIDGDILVYEVCAAGQYKDELTGEPVMRDFDEVTEHFKEKVKQIEAEVWATEPSVIYLGDSENLLKAVNKQRSRESLPPMEWVNNFRVDVAKSRPYKGNRKQEKPLHYNNLRAWIFANYPTKVARGFEADDLLCADLYETHKNKRLDAVACSRDKDLKMVPGMHFGWECGRQPQFGPKRVTELGSLEISKNKKKISGDGMLFFYAQMLTGDSVDNIAGCKGCGPVAAYDLLTNCEQDLNSIFKAVMGKYIDTYGDNWLEHYMENANLLWIIREFNEDGTPVMYHLPEGWVIVGETSRTTVQE